MERKNWNVPPVHAYASPSFGPRQPPFSPGSPRFLNPWPHTSPFRTQSIPHHSSPFRGQFTPHHSTPGQWDQNASPHWSPYSPQPYSDSRDSHWKSRGRRYHHRGQRNEPASIEDYVNDSMLEDPWAHLLPPTEMNVDSQQKDDSATTEFSQKQDESVENMTTELNVDSQEKEKLTENVTTELRIADSQNKDESVEIPQSIPGKTC